ncbi:hypothetical protein COLO4_34993 [Corchorus olitorius]|uniref:Uncharacterized protein n=1 Tax=Corchorus olitorius TaxID=93759 RepID=A0A1R3GIR8_9ROSI|nr:hypothetical protein COLO4_34993 [Corchorus olitorius]
MGAFDRARTEKRAFLMVASLLDWSIGFGDGFNFWTLLGPQPSDSRLSSLLILLPSQKLEVSWSNWELFSFLVLRISKLFRGDPDCVLSSDEE